MYEYDYKIAVIGGGTGLSSILRGLKKYPIDITAIVTVADDGGSSGSLRDELDIPPPGDIRNVLVALSEAEPLVQELFQYRFKEGNGLAGHPTGNLLLAAMTNITGDFATAVRNLSQVLNVRGKILPVCNQALRLCAEYEDGCVAMGESNIPNCHKKIKRVYYQEPCPALEEAVKAVKEADLVILAPGSLYTSIIPNLLFQEMKIALQETKAHLVYCCNIMSQPGETTKFTVSEHVKSIEDHLGFKCIDKVLVNDGAVKEEIIKKYAAENAAIIEIDDEQLEQMNICVIKSRMVDYNKDNEVRHNPKKVAAMIFSLLLDV
ncbi:MAG: YvcK family protein [Defluviitaleaceae bacterium]|nr:YvcK family protein [Defluviitaleaceae bacterium]